MTVAIPPGQRRFAQLKAKDDGTVEQAENSHPEIENAESDSESKIGKENAEAESMDVASDQPSEAEQGKSTSRTKVAPAHHSEGSSPVMSADAASPDTTTSQEAHEVGNAMPQDPLLDVVIGRFHTLNSLESKILDVDGRISSKDAPSSSTWRALRARRNNQDLGSLFEMREEYFVWKDPKTVKTPAKRRS